MSKLPEYLPEWPKTVDGWESTSLGQRRKGAFCLPKGLDNDLPIPY